MDKKKIEHLLIFSMIYLSVVKSHILQQTAFVIMSQDAHDSKASTFKDSLKMDLSISGVETPLVILLHKDLPVLGGWSILPTTESLLKDYSDDIKWFVFLHEWSTVDVNIFETLLQEYDPTQEIFLGKPLQDKHPVIIHYYKETLDIKYPDFSAGFVLSRPLVKRLSSDFQKESKLPLSKIQQSFKVNRNSKEGYLIDPQYELAMRIYELEHENEKQETTEDAGLTLSHDRRFCTKFSEGCATWTSDKMSTASNTKSIYLAKRTLFAVKTCKKYHKERLPILLETWGKAALNIEYFSDTRSKKYNTTLLPEVEKTERGHCQKTYAILKYFERESKKNGWKWLVITDDDTILGVQNLFNLLQNYNPSEPLLLGERYGFLLSKEKLGYDYLSGGAGMVFSEKMVKDMLKNNGKYCYCPNPDDHDDMILAGWCMKNIQKPILHNERFHQNSPSVYSQELLDDREPISFHKFRTIDAEHGTLEWNNPKETYNKYFKESDTFLRTYKKENQKS